jgi:2-oxoacid:acceptor oxidoreductase gamma subunit (pyruvate/2-ketoisovalerate family)
MIEVRFHGRGGQGAKIASRILAQSGFLAGLHAQDFALFGAERRGAPVVSCTRLSEQPIDRRGYVDEPDLVLVMDDALFFKSDNRDLLFCLQDGVSRFTCLRHCNCTISGGIEHEEDCHENRT